MRFIRHITSVIYFTYSTAKLGHSFSSYSGRDENQSVYLEDLATK